MEAGDKPLVPKVDTIASTEQSMFVANADNLVQCHHVVSSRVHAMSGNGNGWSLKAIAKPVFTHEGTRTAYGRRPEESVSL